MTMHLTVNVHVNVHLIIRYFLAVTNFAVYIASSVSLHCLQCHTINVTLVHEYCFPIELHDIFGVPSYVYIHKCMCMMEDKTFI